MYQDPRNDLDFFNSHMKKYTEMFTPFTYRGFNCQRMLGSNIWFAVFNNYIVYQADGRIELKLWIDDKIRESLK